MHLAAIVVEDAGKLERDVSATDDGQLLGPLVQVQDLVAGDGVLCAWDVQRVRSCARRNQDVLGLQTQSSHQ